MSILEVAVAILYNQNGDILINERRADDEHLGHWEFPGGKLESGETPNQALIRECQEELGVDVLSTSPLITFTHAYPHQTVRLHVFIVTQYRHVPRSNEGQALQWVALDSLDKQNLLAADVAIIKALKVPNYCLVTPAIESLEQLDSVSDTISNYFQSQQLTRDKQPSRLMVQLRQHHLSEEEYIQAALNLCHYIVRNEYCKYVQLQLNTQQSMYQKINKLIVKEIDKDIKVGLHLTSKRLEDYMPDETMLSCLGASVHDEKQLDLAINQDVSYVILGMVQPSTSHPDRSALGWDGFYALSIDKGIPIYAIGGLEKKDLQLAHEHNARGVAGIRMFLH